jgi:hypothetical protein
MMMLMMIMVVNMVKGQNYNTWQGSEICPDTKLTVKENEDQYGFHMKETYKNYWYGNITIYNPDFTLVTSGTGNFSATYTNKHIYGRNNVTFGGSSTIILSEIIPTGNCGCGLGRFCEVGSNDASSIRAPAINNGIEGSNFEFTWVEQDGKLMSFFLNIMRYDESGETGYFIPVDNNAAVTGIYRVETNSY